MTYNERYLNLVDKIQTKESSVLPRFFVKSKVKQYSGCWRRLPRITNNTRWVDSNLSKVELQAGDCLIIIVLVKRWLKDRR
ncbi:hypothetical protein PPSC2_27280 (plasmid) [Paenibacillus polymyxa SC2]|uniref:Uncharacterized protein n=1 Tax=Paenibacillus polymyxa (strain SC2) TaxID=886882 RepID=A0A0D5ZCX5_PAEPS|nr:hypothetical protein PPSC2_27280 [Paenibacillus polymyxa SC2]